jgi:hypothetical protein
MIQRPKEKDRRYKGQKKRTDETKAKRPLYHLSFSFGLCIIRPFRLAFVSSVLFFWSLYHLTFSFGLCIICTFILAFASSGPFLWAFVSSVLFFWPLYHLSFSFGLCII